MTRFRSVLLLGLGFSIAVGCGGSKSDGGRGKKKPAATREAARTDEGGGLIRRVTGGPEPSAPGEFPKALLTRLDQAGLKHEGWTGTPGTQYGATTCSQGRVERLAVMLCACASPAVARAAEDKLLGFAPDAVTVVARSAGAIAVAVADVQQVDLKGQQITRVLKVLGVLPDVDVPPPPPPPP